MSSAAHGGPLGISATAALIVRMTRDQGFFARRAIKVF